MEAAEGEYYTEEGRVVFTAAYHLRRGSCCQSGCRHCPYRCQPAEADPPPVGPPQGNTFG